MSTPDTASRGRTARGSPSENPLLGGRSAIATARAVDGARTATLGGTLRKTAVLLTIAIGSGAFASIALGGEPGAVTAVFWTATVGATALAIVIASHPMAAVFLAPVYAALEGAALGLLALVVDAWLPGAGRKALELTIVLAIAMLAVHLVHGPTSEPFRRGIAMATVSIALLYVSDLLSMIVGAHPVFLHTTGGWGVAFSGLVLAVAVFNLLLDLAFVQEQVDQGAPAALEWFGAVAIVFTLAWVYVQIVRFLMALQDDG